MDRRIVPFLVVAAGVALVFLISRQGTRDGRRDLGVAAAPAPGSHDTEPAEQEDLSLRGAQSDRQVVATAEPEVDRSNGVKAPETTAGGGALGGRVVDDLGTPVTRFTIECSRLLRGNPNRVASLDPGFAEKLLKGEEVLDPATLAEITRGRSATESNTKRSFDSLDGSFRLTGLADGEWQLTASTNADQRSSPTLVSTPREGDDVVLVIPRPGRIMGSVLGFEGRPVSNATLYIHYAGEQNLGFSIGPHPEPRANTQPLGAFALEGVQPGTVKIMATHPEYCDSEWMDISVAPGALVQGVEIVLTQGGRIEGLVDVSLGHLADREI